ncbi:MAG: hypothetical protein ACKOUR_20530, partial [Planctomycetota bacterium]
LAQALYAEALDHVDELRGPYAAVIDIDRAQLPSAATVSRWSSDEFTSALRHIPTDPRFNSSFRQLLHVGFKLAAKRGREYLDLLVANEAVVGRNVTENLVERHLRPLLVG